MAIIRGGGGAFLNFTKNLPGNRLLQTPPPLWRFLEKIYSPSLIIIPFPLYNIILFCYILTHFLFHKLILLYFENFVKPCNTVITPLPYFDPLFLIRLPLPSSSQFPRPIWSRIACFFNPRITRRFLITRITKGGVVATQLFKNKKEHNQIFVNPITY